jgi:hypothetical protein
MDSPARERTPARMRHSRFLHYWVITLGDILMRMAVGRLSLLALALILIAGCSAGKTPLYPVTGKVTLEDGTPLTSGVVTYIPDTEKGNTNKVMPGGKIGADGTYTLLSNDKSGAPAGWYKITVVTDYPGAPQDKMSIDPKYADSGKSELAREVVASPAAGAYDLKVSKK